MSQGYTPYYNNNQQSTSSPYQQQQPTQQYNNMQQPTNGQYNNNQQQQPLPYQSTAATQQPYNTYNKPTSPNRDSLPAPPQQSTYQSMQQNGYNSMPQSSPAPSSTQSMSSPYPQPPLASLRQQPQPPSQQYPYNQYQQQQQPQLQQSLDQQFNQMSLQSQQQPSYGYNNQQPPSYPLPNKSGISQIPPSQQQQPQQPYIPQSQPSSYGSAATTQPYPIAPHWVTPVHHKYFQLSCNALPSNQQLRISSCIPFGGTVRPLNDALGTNNTTLPVAVYGREVVRCKQCRIYMNPYVQFVQGGRLWICNVCFVHNEVPQEYYSPLDNEGKRLDTLQRIELTQAAHEIVAPDDYMVRPPVPPVFFFVIDVSKNSILNGSLNIICDTIKQSLNQLSSKPRTLIGFITFDSTLHFYTFDSKTEQPSMFVVTDLEDIFLPTPHELMVNLQDNRTQIDNFLTNLPSMFNTTNDVESCSGSAIEAALLSVNRLGGRVSLFCSSLPSIGLYRLQNRETTTLKNDSNADAAQNTEHAKLQPATDSYKKYCMRASKYQVCVDIYLISTTTYIDVGTLGEIARFTGGEVYYYDNFNVHIHGSKLQHELHHSLVREQGWEAVIRVRATKGISINTFHGNFYLRGNDLLAVPCTDSDKSFTFTLQGDDNNSSEGGGPQNTLQGQNSIIVQSALLYTTSQGERRIRVFTLCVPIVHSIVELYRNINVNAIVNQVAKEAVQLTWQHNFERGRDYIKNTTVTLIRSFYNTGRQNELQDVVEQLNKLPLMSLGLLKNIAFRDSNDIRIDTRSYYLMRLCSMSIKDIERVTQPRLLRVDNTTLINDIGLIKQEQTLVNPNQIDVTFTGQSINTFNTLPLNAKVNLPDTLLLAADSVSVDSLLILDNGIEIIVRLGQSISNDILYQLFGVNSLYELDVNNIQWQSVQLNDTTSYNARFHNIIAQLHNDSVSGLYQSIIVCKQGDPSDMYFLNYLYQDRQSQTLFSLRDYNQVIFGQQQQQSSYAQPPSIQQHTRVPSLPPQQPPYQSTIQQPPYTTSQQSYSTSSQPSYPTPSTQSYTQSQQPLPPYQSQLPPQQTYQSQSYQSSATPQQQPYVTQQPYRR